MDTTTNPSPSLRVNTKSKVNKTKKSFRGEKKKEKQHISSVWTEFVKLPIDEEGLSKAICQWCGKKILVDSHNGTSNLHHHLLKCLKQNEVKEDGEEEEFREMLAETIIKHNLPFSFVEYEGIRKVFKYLNSDVKNISRNTSKADVLKLYKKENDDVKNKLKSIPGRICLTLDLWTSVTNNVSNNDNFQYFIKKKLNEGDLLLYDGIYFHVRCGAHILNLIIRETMKYLKGSESKMCRFDKCAKIVGMKRTKGLCLDVCTRWNATYDMIDKEENANFKHCPSRDEWNRVERITRFLKPFNDITTLFSGIDYPTANLYFQGVSQIELLLLEEMESQDSFISNMVDQMKGKFDKYWDCYSVVLACAIVLDPMYKLDYVDFTFKKIEPIEHIAKMKVEEATTNVSSCVESSSHNSGDVDDPNGDEDVENDEFEHYGSGRGAKTKKSQLDLHLEEPRLRKKKNSKLEVLSWWKENYNHVPITTVDSKSSFSTGKKKFTPYQSHLLPKNVEATLCTKS
ncbi:hypothetical protein ACB092_05G151700 [Castanea dentata]